jgi:cell fate (sporulation/competence/biofilm development) regulator YlbF (YheA/YmcA/DUF963 family)
MIDFLLDAYHLADQINQSRETQAYLDAQKKVAKDLQAQQLIHEFQKVKQLFEEAQRFGIFHPNYHQAKEQANNYQQKLRSHPTIGAFLAAEEKLDHLLFEISTMIASSVSEAIKVPSNDLAQNFKRNNKCSRV